MLENIDPTTDYRTPSGLRVLLASVLEDLRTEKISVKAANSIAHVSNTVLATYRVELLLKKENQRINS